ncbi:MAG: hypothetical protein MI824_13180 [Hyphomicrobiales bacterium]|nr:hypothetical protein [Hyphomicrobiales bacterium]
MRDREVAQLVRVATALALAAGLSVAITGCRASSAGSEPAASPVDQSQPAPARRGSY